MDAMDGEITINLKRTALKWKNKKHMHIRKWQEAHHVGKGCM
jgi:hypothetical protein